MKIIESPNLADYSSIHIGGLGNFLYFPETENELLCLLNEKRQALVFGGGTNVVFANRLYNDIISLSRLACRDLSFIANSATASAGVKLSRFVYEGCRAGWSGLEGLSGIPGTIGGAIIMNAGSKYCCIGDFVKEVRVFSVSSGSAITLLKDDLNFNYRSSSLQDKSDYIVIGVEFQSLESAPASILIERSSSVIRERITSNIKQPNCGSVFKNPEHEFSAGAMIDRLGLKGYTLGGIGVSTAHGNIFINISGATYSDFMNLVEYVTEKVYSEYSVELEMEIKII